jgi:hypothetical protein
VQVTYFSLTFEGNAPFEWSIEKSSIKKLVRTVDEHASLLREGINYERKMSCSKGRGLFTRTNAAFFP